MTEPLRTPRSLLWPYALPYLAYVAIGALGDLRSHAEWIYLARLVVVTGLLAWFWRSYLPLRGPKSAPISVAVGALAGVAGLGLWLALRAPFLPDDAPAWSDSAWLGRAVVSTLLPPVIEELLFRGWALRLGVLASRARSLGNALDHGSLWDVAAGAWTPIAIVASSAAFALGHLPGEWLAAFVYGALMCGLWIARGDLVSCISAHAVTNFLLALWVRAGHWGNW